MRGLVPRDVVDAFIRGGARLLQIRQKSGDAEGFVSLVRDAIAIGRPRGAQVIVNDRADIAALTGADGVHVGQTDLSVADVRRIGGEGLVIGLSTHTTAQVDEALAAGVSYVAVGPVFRTATKDTGYDARGLDLVRYAAAGGAPVVAIGGITLERAAGVLAAGATSVAVISDLVASGDAERRVRAYVDALG